MVPQIVRFSSHPHPFRVVVDRCTNPDCACADVTFFLTEELKDPSSTSGKLALTIRIDPQTWQERAAPDRPAALAAIASEFLRDFPEAEKKAFAELARQKEKTARRMREYRFDPQDMKNSSLAAYNDIASEHGSVSSGGTTYSFSFRHEGRKYLVEDQYCKRPSCQCKEVYLEFLEYKSRAAEDGHDVVEQAFFARLSLSGHLSIEKAFTCTRDEAAKVAAAWQAKFGDALEVLKWRYDKVKEIARRSLPPVGRQHGNTARMANDWRMVQALSSATSPGRNDPCPCGSGKKFKRCCGDGGAARAANSLNEQGGRTPRGTTTAG